jgi:hypothetical protein
MKALVPQKAILPDVKDAQVQNVTPQPLPLDAPAAVAATPIRGEIWEWNAQLGLLFANGGADDRWLSDGEAQRQPVADPSGRHNKMQEDLIACAKELHDSGYPVLDWC